MTKFRLKIRRQLTPEAHGHWEIFEVLQNPTIPLGTASTAGATVLSALLALREKPVNAEGMAVAPVAFDGGCLEEVCGACTMVINGQARPACTARLADLAQPVSLEPLRSFVVLRDLCVDLTRVLGALERARAWGVVDGTEDAGFLPGGAIPLEVPSSPGAAVGLGTNIRSGAGSERSGPMSQALTRRLIELSRCTLCAACLDACPQYSATGFVGAAVIHRVHVLNQVSGGADGAVARLDALTLPGGISDCGNAQACVKACPQGLPLAESIATAGRAVTRQAIKKFLG